MLSRVRDLSHTILSKAAVPTSNVVVDRNRAEQVANLLREVEISIPTWDFPPVYPQSDDFEEMCLFYLLLNAINYCYFDENKERFQDGKLRGSTLATTRLTEAWDEIKDPQFLAHVDENYLLNELFPAEIPISMVKERTQALREVGEFLLKNTDFTFERFFKKYKQDAYFASQMLPTHLPTWRDPFFKRAQLFVGMVYGKFQGRKDLPIEEDGLKFLTVFADYRIPQTLIKMGIIRPGNTLLGDLYAGRFIPSGSRKELEIRAATIIGSDVLTEELNKFRPDTEPLNALHTDFLLWSAARSQSENLEKGVFVIKEIDHHYTITTDY